MNNIIISYYIFIIYVYMNAYDAERILTMNIWLKRNGAEKRRTQKWHVR